MFDKLRTGAEKAGASAGKFLNNAGSKVVTESRGLAQGFSLPGEADKAAKLLESFLGLLKRLNAIILSI